MRWMEKARMEMTMLPLVTTYEPGLGASCYLKIKRKWKFYDAPNSRLDINVVAVCLNASNLLPKGCKTLARFSVVFQ